MRGRVAVALGVACALAGALRAEPAAQAWAADPVYVYYPRSDCRGSELALEVWNRDAETWVAHPGHPRVPVESCQLEDAGTLFNELRWRCIEGPDVDPPAPWVVGVEVFDPAVMQSCALGQQEAAGGALEVHVVSPAPGESIALAEMEVPVRGSVRMDGIAGTEYDVLLVIDRSEATAPSAAGRDAGGADDLLAAQVAAARAWLAQVAPRLGPVRIGLVTYPNLPPLPGSPQGTGAARALALSDDPAEIRGALDAVLARGSAGFQTFGSAFQFALDELAGARGERTRPGARKVLVLLANARTGSPFGIEASRDARFRSRIAQRIVQAAEARVQLHVYAIGGLSEALAPGMPELFERADVRFRHVLHAALGRPFLNEVSLPELTRVEVANRTMGGAELPARIAPDGTFQVTLATAPGTNRLWARATLSDGATAEREWSFEFDMSRVRERLLAKEREHMQRVREKHLEVRPARRDERLAPGIPVPVEPPSEPPARRD